MALRFIPNSFSSNSPNTSNLVSFNRLFSLIGLQVIPINNIPDYDQYFLNDYLKFILFLNHHHLHNLNFIIYCKTRYLVFHHSSMSHYF